MSNAKLPDVMKQVTLADFHSEGYGCGYGWVVYVDPSAMFADEQKNLWLDPEAACSPSPDEVSRMAVEYGSEFEDSLVVYRVPGVFYKVGSKDSPAKVIPVAKLKNGLHDPFPLAELEEDD